MSVDDGETAHNFYSPQNVWTQRLHTKGDFADDSQFVGLLVWTNTLLRLSTASDFQIQKQKDDSLLVSSKDTKYQAVFTSDGMLQSWKYQGGGGTTELRFSAIELNKALPPETFNWIQPPGAARAAPENMRFPTNWRFGL